MLGRGGALTVRASADGAGGVRVQVVDTGPGIPAAVLPRIFQPFFTTRAGTDDAGGRRGTGLGLSICKDIVEHHGGTIECRSVLGKGTTFTLRLPAAA